MKDNRIVEWEAPGNLGENKRRPHVPTRSHSSRASAVQSFLPLLQLPTKEQRVQSLGGQ